MKLIINIKYHNDSLEKSQILIIYKVNLGDSNQSGLV